MASSHWQSKSSLNELSERPYRFDFFAAMRLVECESPDLPRIGTAMRPADETIRLSQRPRMDFVPSSITSVKWDSVFQKWEIDCQFFGMFGPHGALPIELTEYAMARIRDHRDDTLYRFVDCFYHRMMSFFYRAYAAVEPAVQFDRPDEDRFAAYIGSSLGIGQEEFKHRDQMPDLAKLQFSGHLAQQNHHAEGLAKILNGIFRVPISIDQFVGCWLDIPQSDQVELGANEFGSVGVLGQSATIGSRVWESQQCIRINIGPLQLSDYLEFLPTRDPIKMLSDTIKNYCGLALTWKARVALIKDQVPELQLGHGAQLGWNSWLTGDEHADDANDLEIDSEQLDRRNRQTQCA